MPPLPVIEDVYRVTWNFTQDQGVTPRIVQHYWSPSSDVDVLGASLVAATEDGIFQPMPASFEPFDIDVLPLDGTTPTRNFDMPPTHHFCNGGSQGIPAAALIMKWTTAVRGPRGRGRSYIGPVAEDMQDSGQAIAGALSTLTGAWNDMLTTLAGLSPIVSLCVASYTHSDFNVVTGISAERTLGTQRRRQDQLR